MESLHGNTFWILPGIIITIIVMVAWTCLDNYIKYKQFKAKLIPGAKLMCIIKCIDDEFDPGIEFHIEIMKRSVNQVRIRYSDGSEITKDMFVLYAEPWVFED